MRVYRVHMAYINDEYFVEDIFWRSLQIDLISTANTETVLNILKLNISFARVETCYLYNSTIFRRIDAHTVVKHVSCQRSSGYGTSFNNKIRGTSSFRTACIDSSTSSVGMYYMITANTETAWLARWRIFPVIRLLALYKYKYTCWGEVSTNYLVDVSVGFRSS